MSLPLIIRPEAEQDLAAAQAWYEGQRAGLGQAFLARVDQMLAKIQLMPELYAELYRGVRGGKLKRFPYVVYYRVLSDRIEVLAVLHGSRDPAVWQARA